MCSCNSIWVQNANNFLYQHNNQDALYFVVEYLINNNICRRENGVYLNTLLNYVNSNGYNYNRESFQHSVLIPLKQRNILVSLPYPGRIGGIFIPCNINEIKQAYKQILIRVQSELNNISYVAISSNIANNLNNILNLIQSELNNL